MFPRYINRHLTNIKETFIGYIDNMEVTEIRVELMENKIELIYNDLFDEIVLEITAENCVLRDGKILGFVEDDIYHDIYTFFLGGFDEMED